MLKWVFSVPDANTAMNDGVVLDVASVQARHEKIPNACIDENVNCFKSESISLMMDGFNCVRSWRRSLTPATKCVKGSYWNVQLYAVIVIYHRIEVYTKAKRMVLPLVLNESQ